jgi:hypothetical protein
MEASELQDEHDFKTWKDEKDLKLSHAKMPKIQASYNMAWQQTACQDMVFL